MKPEERRAELEATTNDELADRLERYGHPFAECRLAARRLRRMEKMEEAILLCSGSCGGMYARMLDAEGAE